MHSWLPILQDVRQTRKHCISFNKILTFFRHFFVSSGFIFLFKYFSFFIFTIVPRTFCLLVFYCNLLRLCGERPSSLSGRSSLEKSHHHLPVRESQDLRFHSYFLFLFYLLLIFILVTKAHPASFLYHIAAIISFLFCFHFLRVKKLSKK